MKRISSLVLVIILTVVVGCRDDKPLEESQDPTQPFFNHTVVVSNHAAAGVVSIDSTKLVFAANALPAGGVVNKVTKSFIFRADSALVNV